jgi:hypothetical protein
VADAPRLADHLYFLYRSYPGRRVTTMALAGAFDEFARSGGGTVEGYTEDVTDRA